MSDDEIVTHAGARALADIVLRRAHPPAKVVRHDYDSAQPAGRLGIEWRDAGHPHGAVLRYRLPCRERARRHDAAALRDGKSHAHLRG